MLFHARKHDVFCDGQQAAGAARQPDKKVGTDRNLRFPRNLNR